MTDLAIATAAISCAFLAHLIEIALWAALLVVCGEFGAFGNALYLSAVNYTALGYGDLLLTPSWRLLGPLEAANGVLMFGVSTAMVFAVIKRLVLARFVDLRSYETMRVYEEFEAERHDFTDAPKLASSAHSAS